MKGAQRKCRSGTAECCTIGRTLSVVKGLIQCSSIGSALGPAGKHIGKLDDFVPSNDAVLNRPVNIPLLRVDSLRFRKCHDKVAALKCTVIDFSAGRGDIAALDQFDIAADDGNDVL